MKRLFEKFRNSAYGLGMIVSPSLVPGLAPSFERDQEPEAPPHRSPQDMVLDVVSNWSEAQLMGADRFIKAHLLDVLANNAPRDKRGYPLSPYREAGQALTITTEMPEEIGREFRNLEIEVLRGLRGSELLSYPPQHFEKWSLGRKQMAANEFARVYSEVAQLATPLTITIVDDANDPYAGSARDKGYNMGTDIRINLHHRETTGSALGFLMVLGHECAHAVCQQFRHDMSSLPKETNSHGALKGSYIMWQLTRPEFYSVDNHEVYMRHGEETLCNISGMRLACHIYAGMSGGPPAYSDVVKVMDGFLNQDVQRELNEMYASPLAFTGRMKAPQL